jgi:hypothetical protein
MSWRSVLGLLLLAFAAGAAGFAWLSSEGGVPWAQTTKSVAALPEDADVPPPITGFAAPSIIQPSASQAEAALLVMSARRAIEAGKPLGDLGSRLQASFGQSQPAAIAAIASGVRKPVSNAALLAGFDGIAPQLILPTGTAWERMRYEFNTLFVLRSRDIKPTASATRIDRIRQHIIAGEIADAAKLVRSLPGAAQATDWLADANRAIAVHRALDSLGQAAIAVAPPPAPSPPTLVIPPQPTADVSAVSGAPPADGE